MGRFEKIEKETVIRLQYPLLEFKALGIESRKLSSKDACMLKGLSSKQKAYLHSKKYPSIITEI